MQFKATKYIDILFWLRIGINARCKQGAGIKFKECTTLLNAYQIQRKFYFGGNPLKPQTDVIV